MSSMRLMARLAPGLLLVACLGGCVTLPPNAPRSKADPWERMNRGIYKFNDGFDRAIAKPIAKAYVFITPVPIRTGINNFFNNLETPTVLANDILQLKPLASLQDIGRFVLNSTVGIGGLLDPATHVGLPRNNEDFGQTLGYYGLKPGPYIMLPILGPSDLRDAPARLVDDYTNPRHYIKNLYWRYGLYLVNLVNVRSTVLPLDDTLKNVYDPYAFVRDAYLQHRAYLVADGKVKDEEPLFDPGADDAPAAESETKPAPPPGAGQPPGAEPAPGQN